MGRLSPADFHTVYGFRRPNVTPLERSRQVCGLDYPFTLLRKFRSLGAARLVSTPSRLCLSGLGSGLPLKVSPNLSSSASPVSRRALKSSLSPLRMPFRHARARLSDCISIIGQICRDLHVRPHNEIWEARKMFTWTRHCVTSPLLLNTVSSNTLREYDIMTQGNGTKHSALEIKHNPCWRMVARIFLPARPSVNTAVHQPVRQIR